MNWNEFSSGSTESYAVSEIALIALNMALFEETAICSGVRNRSW